MAQKRTSPPKDRPAIEGAATKATSTEAAAAARVPAQLRNPPLARAFPPGPDLAEFGPLYAPVDIASSFRHQLPGRLVEIQGR
jgi:hypothetical protein